MCIKIIIDYMLQNIETTRIIYNYACMGILFPFQGTELNLAGSQHQSINSVPSYDLPKSGLGLARDVRHVKPPWK
jgi:hypothetical protein